MKLYKAIPRDYRGNEPRVEYIPAEIGDAEAALKAAGYLVFAPTIAQPPPPPDNGAAIPYSHTVNILVSYAWDGEAWAWQRQWK